MYGIADSFTKTTCNNVLPYLYPAKENAALNVVDAYRIMKTNGPRGRSASDVVLAKGLFISPGYCSGGHSRCKFFNQVREMPLDTVGHLAKGEALKVGTMNLDKLNVKRIKM